MYGLPTDAIYLPYIEKSGVKAYTVICPLKEQTKHVTSWIKYDTESGCIVRDMEPNLICKQEVLKMI